jgi:multidrug resistance efflux pump
VRASVDGTVLQVKVRPGEFAMAGPLAEPLMLLGRTDVLHIRVDVDENEASRVRPGAAAVAYVRGNNSIRADLKFVRIEPYIVPKRSLTGDTTERVDTRVLQVLYSFDPKGLPVYVGQQMDVYIDAPSIAGPSTTQSARAH